MAVGFGLTLFPPTAPIGVVTMLASSISGLPGIAYGTGRSIYTLVDRNQHNQTISLADPEARRCWLLTACFFLSAGSFASSQLLAIFSRNGNLVARWMRIGVTGLVATKLSVSTINMINIACDLIQKDELSALDWFQMISSVFFLTHSWYNFQTAGDIIKRVQQRDIETLRQNLDNETQKKFDSTHKQYKNLGGEMHGQAEFIRNMSKFGYKEIFAHFQGSYSSNSKILVVLTEFAISASPFLYEWCNGEQNFIDFATALAESIIKKLNISNKDFYVNLLKYIVQEVQKRARIWLERHSGTEQMAREQVIKYLKSSNELMTTFKKLYKHFGQNVFNHLSI